MTLKYISEHVNNPFNTLAAQRCQVKRRAITYDRIHGVMVGTQDFESCDPSSNLGGTLFFFFLEKR